jgi:hypothetical protein
MNLKCFLIPYELVAPSDFGFLSSNSPFMEGKVAIRVAYSALYLWVCPIS